MHERTILADLIRAIEAAAVEHGASDVVTIRVRLGALSHMTPDHFREHFADAAEGTAAAGARIEVVAETDPTASGADGIILESIEVVET